VQACDATPPAELRARLLDSSVAKDEEKHFAARYILDLERVLRELFEAHANMLCATDYLPGDKRLRLDDAKQSAERILKRITKATSGE
jgi:DNA repair protein RadC